MLDASLLALLKCPGGIAESELEELRAARGWSVAEACNQLAYALAVEYLGGRMDFEAADLVANQLWFYSFQIEGNVLPHLSTEVFMAFDVAEWRHPNEPEDLDLEEAYTRPRLEKLLAEQRGPQA